MYDVQPVTEVDLGVMAPVSYGQLEVNPVLTSQLILAAAHLTAKQSKNSDDKVLH